MSIVFHSSDYPDFFIREAPEYFRAALHVYATAVGSMQRPAEDQLADVRLLENALGGHVIPNSSIERFHQSCLLLFHDSLMVHYRNFEYGPRPSFAKQV